MWASRLLPQIGELPDITSRDRVPSSPIVTVALPVYNAEPYLREALDSILGQTFSDFELIAIDDGSVDASYSILKGYEANDSRIKVRRQNNRGVSATRNEIISLARGEFIATMDADDVCLPLRFEKQVAFLRLNPGHVLVGGWSEFMSAEGLPIGVIESPTTHPEIDQANLIGHTSIAHPTSMIRRQALLDVDGYDDNILGAEDLDLYLRLAEIGKLANLPEIVLRYRVHINSISATKSKQQLLFMRQACELACKRRLVDRKFEGQEWHVAADKESQHKFSLQYGWISWRNGYRRTWWKYAREALAVKPFSLLSWKLLVFGLLKSPK